MYIGLNPPPRLVGLRNDRKEFENLEVIDEELPELFPEDDERNREKNPPLEEPELELEDLLLPLLPLDFEPLELDLELELLVEEAGLGVGIASDVQAKTMRKRIRASTKRIPISWPSGGL